MEEHCQCSGNVLLLMKIAAESNSCYSDCVNVKVHRRKHDSF